MSDDLDKLKEDMSKLAERVATEGFGVTLDYSIESVKEVEKLLSTFHKEYKTTGSDDGMTGLAFEFAAYIVKVIERNIGPVRWERNHPEMGDDSFPLYLDDGALFPFGWCIKRIFDGPADDVWTKFNVFVLKQDPPKEEKKGFFDKMFGKT